MPEKTGPSPRPPSGHTEKRTTVAELQAAWTNSAESKGALAAYTGGQTSYVVGLLPPVALAWGVSEVIALLRARHGEVIDLALSAGETDPECPPRAAALRSPAAQEPNGEWLKCANIVGINVRTIGNFFNIIKYSLTLPMAQPSIHILPIWEPGVVASLYGPCSWEINPEFFSAELAATYLHLDTAAKQLRAVTNLIHATGRTVGMDVVPHVDRYAECVLSYPDYFEWLVREDKAITDHRENLHEDVAQTIWAWLVERGPACAGETLPDSRAAFFSAATDEAQRARLLFGRPQDFDGRRHRRIALIKCLRQHNFEPVPATMGPPYRGLAVDADDAHEVVDEHGMRWRDFVITRPEHFSRAFNPLARYKLYAALNDNQDWEVDFASPQREVWDYVCRKYAEVQQRFGFDFMRGDMSHVQMRPDGVPEQVDDTYDIMRTVKRTIQQQGGAPYFAYYAENFLSPKNIMMYGDELDHLEVTEAEVTLGDLQSNPIDSAFFSQEFRRYIDANALRRVSPCFTIMTADKDDPRFDAFYLVGNELRLFVGLFVRDLCSYMGLGFELRDPHPEPAPNEHYTKLYVFQEKTGPKATRGPYTWGQNVALFSRLTAVRQQAEALDPALGQRPTRWLIPPSPTANSPLIAWTQADATTSGAPSYVFIAHLGATGVEHNSGIPDIPGVGAGAALEFVFSTHPEHVGAPDRLLRHNGYHFRLASLAGSECRIYRLRAAP